MPVCDMHEGSGEALSRRALVVGALVSLIGFLTLTLVVTRHGTDGVDCAARTLVHRPSHRALQSSMEAVSFAAGRPGQAAVVCLGATLLRRRGRWAVGLPLVMAGAGILQGVAKWAVDRPRPNLDPWDFPSAHVLTVVVLFGYLAYVLATSRTRRNVGVVLSAVIVCAVAFSRMYLDAHWLSDVAGGFAMGLAYLLGAIWLLGSQWDQSARSRNDESSCGPIHTQKQRTHTSSRMAATESGPTSSVNG